MSRRELPQVLHPLDKKLLRDLWHIKGQALAISLVIAAGVAMFINYLSTFESLRSSQETYYQRYRFADVFASLRRAPEDLAHRIAWIPGVAQIETRVVADVNLDIPGLKEPATGRLISLPKERRAQLNDVYLRQGRFPEPGHSDEVLVSEAFAQARRLLPGATVTAVINGHRRQLEIVGIALSPEYIYTIRPGELIPDDSRFGIFWMERRALATAFDMEGGMNDVALTLMPGASVEEVIAQLDLLLDPYGGLGAVPRALQLSHWYIDNELKGLQGAGFIVPVIFLAVAGFLLHVVLNRIVAVQREQIAALKALGYTDFEVGRHYAAWSVVIGIMGLGLGIAGGSWLGSGMTALYGDFFRFPLLTYHLPRYTVAIGALVSVGVALLAALGAVQRAIRLPPAEAMRPEPPAHYRVSWIERLGLKHVLGQPARIILRNLERYPGRAFASILGIALAVAILIVGLFFIDAIDVIMDIQFNVKERQDLTMTFFQPVSARAFHEVSRLPGVLTAEPARSVPVRLVAGHRSRQTSILGLSNGTQLHRVIDVSLKPIALPPEGLVLSTMLAEILGLRRGDTLQVEVLAGRRPVRQVVVADLVEEYQGTSAYMEAAALHRLLREGQSLSGAFLQIDASQADELYRRFKLLPAVAGVSLKSAAIESFERTIAQNLNVMVFFNVIFASIIAFGVVYNAARISLSERSRELATLRVVGFTRAEISFILLGELAALTTIAIPLGLALGFWLARLVLLAYNNELLRIPLVVGPLTLALSVGSVVIAAMVSGLIVRRRLDHLDLVQVLKTRE